MLSLSEHIAFVNEQLAFHEKKAADFVNKEWRHKLHSDTAQKFRQLASALVAAQAELLQTTSKNKPQISGHQLLLALDDIDGLPDELIKELSISAGDRTEFAITSLVDEAGGILSLDKILIGLFKKTGEIHKRQALTNRLYRMSTKGLIFSVPNKKGAYSTQQLTEEDVGQLLKLHGRMDGGAI